MKLFAKYNRINLLSTVVIFLLAGIAFSFLLRYVVISQVDEDLRIEQHEILTYISKYGALPAIIEVHDQYTTYQPVEQLPRLADHFFTKKEHDRHDDELVRSIEFGAAVNNQFYLVTVSKSLEGTDNLIQSIILIMVGTIILILTATFFINRFILHKLWQPFYHTLAAIQDFKLSDVARITFPATATDEFTLLNATLSSTINKAQQDYLVLKEFTENASHEMQTPLAVVQAKLDGIIQSEQLTEAQSIAAQGAYDAIKHLKKLNQSLLLLAKIENQQFSEKVNIDLEQVIQHKQQQFCEQWQSRQIQVHVKLSPAAICGNVQLIDILLNNLISNATRHNSSNGDITIILQPLQLTISNTGEAQPLDERYIYNRFYKGKSMTGQYGLGLSIVKQICDVSGYTCQYHFCLPNIHSFIVKWSLRS